MTRRRRGVFCDGWDGASTEAGRNRARRAGSAKEVGGRKASQGKVGLEWASRPTAVGPVSGIDE